MLVLATAEWITSMWNTCYREECEIILLFFFLYFMVHWATLHGWLAEWLPVRLWGAMLTQTFFSSLPHPPTSLIFLLFVLHCPLPLPHPPALLRRWLYGKTVCSVYAFCGMLFGICSLTTLTLLSMVCFVKVCYPLYGKSSKKLFFARWNDIWINHHIPKWTIVDLSPGEEKKETIIPPWSAAY